MQLRREFFLGVGSLAGFNILLALGAIGLFTRMSPAIERILKENVYSNEAAEEMMAVLLDSSSSTTAQESFAAALERARQNVTEPEEIPVLEHIEENRAAALAGERPAVARVVRDVRQLVEINRRAMTAADRRAQRLGTAGAWAAVFIALVSFVLSAMVILGLERRVLAPLVELHAVLEAARAGDSHRRCRVLPGSVEIQRVLTAVNALLERLLLRRGRDENGRTQPHNGVERSALVHLLEQQDRGMVLVDERGQIVAANNTGLALLNGENGERLRALLPARRSHPQQESPGIELTPLRGGGWLCAVNEG